MVLQYEDLNMEQVSHSDDEGKEEERWEQQQQQGEEEGLVWRARPLEAGHALLLLLTTGLRSMLTQVLRRVLPAGMEVPSSFESAGHIARLNLRPEALPYKRLIAEVLLDKNPRIRTVVNKVSSPSPPTRQPPPPAPAQDHRV